VVDETPLPEWSDEGIVKAGEMLRLRKDGLRGRDERQSLRDVQRREMCGRSKVVHYLRRDELVHAELRAAMNDAVSDCPWRSVHMLADGRSDGRKCVNLRFEDTIALQQPFSAGRTNLQSAVVPSNTCRASGQQGLFVVCAAIVDAKFQRRRTAVEHED